MNLKVCECGCGAVITPKPWHRSYGTPRFVAGLLGLAIEPLELPQIVRAAAEQVLVREPATGQRHQQRGQQSEDEHRPVARHQQQPAERDVETSQYCVAELIHHFQVVVE